MKKRNQALIESGELDDVIKYLHLWYETYSKIIRFIGTIAVSILFFTVTFLLKDFLSGTYSYKLRVDDIVNVKRSIVIFGISLFFVFVNLLATYNWFVSGVERAINKCNIDYGVLGDQFKYRKHMGPMRFWGTLSLITGWLAGLTLIVGISIYVFGVWNMIDVLIKSR